jgi:SOS-response transcriptional repressor LexA
MDPDPGPIPRTKGDQRKKKILEAIVYFTETQRTDPSIQDLKKISGIRSFDTLTRHLKDLQQEGLIESDQHLVTLKLKPDAAKPELPELN